MEANEQACREALLEIHDLIGQYLRRELVVESLCMRIKNKINNALAAAKTEED